MVDFIVGILVIFTALVVPCTILVSENDYSEKHPVCYLTKEYHFAFLSSAKIGYNQFIKFLNVALIPLCAVLSANVAFLVGI